MKNMCLVRKQLLQRAFQTLLLVVLLNITAWAAISIPKTPKLWEVSAARGEVYSQQERPPVLTAILSPSLRLLHVPCMLLHIKGQTQLSTELLSPLSSINHVYLLRSSVRAVT